MGIEALVIRTKENNLEDYKNFNEISVISGGFGNTSHPTQALVDVATLTKLNKFSYEVPVTYVGDLKHSRVFSSGRELLTKLGFKVGVFSNGAVSYTHLRAHETDSYLVCRLLLEKKK